MPLSWPGPDPASLVGQGDLVVEPQGYMVVNSADRFCVLRAFAYNHLF